MTADERADPVVATLALVGSKASADAVHDAVALVFPEVPNSRIEVVADRSTSGQWIYQFKTGYRITGNETRPRSLASANSGPVRVTVKGADGTDQGPVREVTNEVRNWFWVGPVRESDGSVEFDVDPARGPKGAAG